MAEKAATQFPTSDAETYLQLDDLTGSVSTKVLTGSSWIKSSSSDAQVWGFAINSAGINCYRITLQADGSITLTCWDSTGTIRVRLDSDSTGYNDGDWHHVAFSFDTATATQDAQLYIDGVSDMTTATTLSDAEIDFDTGGASFHRVGINVTGASSDPFDGCLTEYWLGWEYVDLSSEIENFYNDGKAVPLGSDGSTPTGRQPEVYLTGGQADIATNLGSGEDFTEVEAMGSSLADCSDGPEIFALTKATGDTTRLGLYGGPRAEIPETTAKDEIAPPVVEDVAPPGGGRGGKKRRTSRYPRRVSIDGVLYWVNSAEEERRLLEEYRARLEREALELALEDAPKAKVAKARMKVVRVQRRVEAVDDRDAAWLDYLREEDEIIISAIH